MRRLVRTLPSLCALIVGAASFALSYVALRDVAAHLRAVPAYLAFLVPVVVDGGIIAGSAIIWETSYSARRRHVFPYIFVGILVVMSVTMNVAHAGPAPLAKVIAALPPLVLLGAIELVAAQHMRSAADTTAVEAADVAQPAVVEVTKPSTPAPAPMVDAPAPGTVTVPATPVPGQPTVIVGLPPAGSGSVTAPTTRPVAPQRPATATPPTSQPVDTTPTPDAEPSATVPARPAASAGASHSPAMPQLDNPEPDRRTSTTRRPLRTRAASPDDEPVPATADVLRLPPLADTDGLPAADLVRLLFAEYVKGGGSAEHPQLANSIASQLELTPSYVRKLIRPLREAAAAA